MFRARKAACRSRRIFLKDKKRKMDWLCRSRGRRTAAKSWNAAEAGVQLLSEGNLAGGVRASKEGKG